LIELVSSEGFRGYGTGMPAKKLIQIFCQQFLKFIV